jgi:hypothetical protein
MNPGPVEGREIVAGPGRGEVAWRGNLTQYQIALLSRHCFFLSSTNLLPCSDLLYLPHFVALTDICIIIMIQFYLLE